MNTKYIFRKACLGLLLGWSSVSFGQIPPLNISIIAKPPTTNVVAFYDGYDTGGNTSVAFDGENIYKWSGTSPYKAEPWGYFTPDGREVPYIKRDRDLGQTFTYTGSVARQLTAVTVSTGYGTNVVRAGMYGRRVSMQLFEVTGEPTRHTNGSEGATNALHGFPHNRPALPIPPERDDYLVGEEYRSLGVFSGAVFPDKVAFGFASADVAVPPNHPNLKGRYLRFVFTDAKPIWLQPGKRYSFLVMLEQIGLDCGFTLANHYSGTYAAGHAIRRDGNGQFPPVPADPRQDFTHPANAKALASAHFPTDLSRRVQIPPGTNGYPDVDTWRDLLFYVEAR
ncbi:hypothetical protein [Rudanella paleaurantiibacter]|uniref:hypothetical protein n=1 Tax=Rudanella paleaurantiibacter TaxID=2614655 RepID=UPI001FE71ACC|nr:hypothetical protein [Rudanella paleaurantiibacter]